jgi:hypothetical protein
LEQFLAKELNNDLSRLELIIEEELAEQVYVSESERLKHMQDVNPDFKRLKTVLGLDLL